jgi:hypothetical protein
VFVCLHFTCVLEMNQTDAKHLPHSSAGSVNHEQGRYRPALHASNFVLALETSRDFCRALKSPTSKVGASTHHRSATLPRPGAAAPRTRFNIAITYQKAIGAIGGAARPLDTLPSACLEPCAIPNILKLQVSTHV